MSRRRRRSQRVRTRNVLESYGMERGYAENGREGSKLGDARVDLVLMDLMMPELDGYETIRASASGTSSQPPAGDRAHREGDEGRPRPEHPGGRVGLHQAVDTDQLLSLMRVWLYQ